MKKFKILKEKIQKIYYPCYDANDYIGNVYVEKVNPEDVMSIVEVVFADRGVTQVVCFADKNYCFVVNDAIAKTLRGEKNEYGL